MGLELEQEEIISIITKDPAEFVQTALGMVSKEKQSLTFVFFRC